MAHLFPDLFLVALIQMNQIPFFICENSIPDGQPVDGYQSHNSIMSTGDEVSPDPNVSLSDGSGS